MNTETRQKDLRCIWMVAGVVNYKLCEKNFDCGHCEFHKIMQGILPEQVAGRKAFSVTNPGRRVQKNASCLSHLVNSYIYFLLSDRHIYLDRCYNRTHLWCKPREADQIEVGLDSFIFKLLEPVDKMILPEVGIYYQKGQLIAWIVRGKNMIPLHSPTKGRVTAINPEIKSGDVRRVVLDDQFLFSIQESGLREWLLDICGGLNGLQWFTESVEIVRHFMSLALQSSLQTPSGGTMADGGTLEWNLEKVLGEKLYHEMIKTLFSAK